MGSDGDVCMVLNLLGWTPVATPVLYGFCSLFDSKANGVVPAPCMVWLHQDVEVMCIGNSKPRAVCGVVGGTHARRCTVPAYTCVQCGKNVFGVCQQWVCALQTFWSMNWFDSSACTVS